MCLQSKQMSWQTKRLFFFSSMCAEQWGPVVFLSSKSRQDRRFTSTNFLDCISAAAAGGFTLFSPSFHRKKQQMPMPIKKSLLFHSRCKRTKQRQAAVSPRVQGVSAPQELIIGHFANICIPELTSKTCCVGGALDGVRKLCDCRWFDCGQCHGSCSFLLPLPLTNVSFLMGFLLVVQTINT